MESTILLVTSEPRVSEDLSGLIRSAGYDVSVRDCGDDIPRLVRFSCPKLTIIDCELKDSFDLIKAIRSDPFTQRLALVTFAVANDEWRARAIAAGADAFVTKGKLDWAELLDQIRRHVGGPVRKGAADER